MIIRAEISIFVVAVVMYVLGVLTGAEYKKRRIRELERQLNNTREYWVRIANKLQERIYEQSKKEGLI